MVLCVSNFPFASFLAKYKTKFPQRRACSFMDIKKEKNTPICLLEAVDLKETCGSEQLSTQAMMINVACIFLHLFSETEDKKEH